MQTFQTICVQIRFISKKKKKKICNVNFSRSGLAEDKVDFSEKQIKKIFFVFNE